MMTPDAVRLTARRFRLLCWCYLALLVVTVPLAIALPILLIDWSHDEDREIVRYAECLADPQRPLHAEASQGYVVNFTDELARAHVQVQIGQGLITIEEIRQALDEECN